MMTLTERRRRPRLAVRRFAHVVQENDNTGECIESTGVTTDVSEGGLRFHGTGIFDPYRDVEVAFALGETIIGATGRVRHLTFNSRGDVAIGVQFTDLCEEDRRRIETYCCGYNRG